MQVHGPTEDYRAAQKALSTCTRRRCANRTLRLCDVTRQFVRSDRPTSETSRVRRRIDIMRGRVAFAGRLIGFPADRSAHASQAAQPVQPIQ